MAKRSRLRRLRAERLERRLLLTTVINADPPPYTHNAATSTDISATFDQDLVAGTATAENFVVHGTMSRGRLGGAATSVSASGPVITHNPTSDFAPGEVVQVTATSGITTTGGAAAKRVWQFRTASSGSGVFADGGAGLGSNAYEQVSLGDVDGDGDLDAVLGGSELWLNDGSGSFTYGQDLGVHLYSFGLEFADIDGDGDLDFVAGGRVMTNNGSGVFTNTGVDLGGGAAIPGDLDGDGDIDLMTARPYDTNRVLLNDGNGNFSDTGQALASNSTDAVILGDFDNDGDLDAFEVNQGPGNRVFFNDGSGNFTRSGQDLGGFRAGKDADVGDVDGDGDLDVVVANVYSNTGARIYLNDGDGLFFESGQSVGGGTGNLYRVRLGDFDGDGDLDIFAPQRSAPGSEIWLNDGLGTFSDSGQRLFFGGARRIDGADVGDLDGDGDLDIIEVLASSVGGARVWFNQNLEPNVSLSVAPASIAEAAGEATVTATLSETHTEPVTVDLSVGGTATENDDFTVSSTQIVIPAGDTTGSVTVNSVQDSVDEPDETVTLSIAEVINGQGSGSVSVTIVDDDEPPIPDVTLSVDNDSIAEAGGTATFTATLSTTTTVAVTVDLTMSGTATAGSDYTVSGSQIIIAAGSSSGSITVTAIDDDHDEPNETVVVDIASVTGGNEVGTQQATTAITDDDAPPGLGVALLTSTRSGFVAELTSDLDPGALNLYDTQPLGAGVADVTLVGASSGLVRGSLIVDESLRLVTFVKAGGPLEPDTYTVTLRSGDAGFKDAGGQLLDGNGDGTAGDDFSDSFMVAAPAAGTVTLRIPDFTRGPGQEVNLPANTTAGIPVTISEGDNVRAVDLRIAYDPSKLSITGATVSADAPAGATVITNTTTPGLAIVVFFSSASLPAGSSTLVNLQATVPTENAGDIYGTQQVLDLHGAVVSDGNDNEALVQVDDAVHLVSYFSDVSGNRRVNAADASQVARFAALIDTGFAGSILTDPILAGDVSGNNRINAADASLVAQFAALISVPVIPPIPGGVVFVAAPSVLVEVERELITGGVPELQGGEDLLGFEVEELFSTREVERNIDAALTNEETSLASLDEVLDELCE